MKIYNGDLGEDVEEWEVLPEYQPFEVPETVPSEEPDKELIPA